MKNTLALHWLNAKIYEMQEISLGQGHPMRRKATVYGEHVPLPNKALSMR